MHNTSTQRRRLFGLFGMALAMSFGMPAQAAKKLSARLTAGGPGSAETLPLALFKDFPELTEGIDIEWAGGDPGQVQTLLLAGAVDGSAYGALGVAEAALKGHDLVIFGPKISNHGSWLVRGDSPYQTLADLKGKRIASLNAASDTYRQARIAAMLNGFDLKKDFEVVFGTPIANQALFKRGDVDAIISIEPNSTRLIGAGAREISRVADQWAKGTGDTSPFFLIGIGGRRAWVDANPAAARRVSEIFLAVNRLIARKPELAAEYHEALGIPASETQAIALLPQRMPPLFLTSWGPEQFASIDRQIAEAVKLGLLEKAPGRRLYVQP